MIAENAASFINEGSALKSDIAAVPNLVARALVQGRSGDGGVHSEMFADSLFALALAGEITDARKSENRGVSVMTFALGSAGTYEYLNDNPRVGAAPVTCTNDPAVTARNPRMVSINSVLDVDLHGQIVVDTLGVRQ